MRGLVFMEALGITVLFSVLLGLFFMAAFVWDHRNRGGDARDREALKPLEDDANESRSKTTGIPRKS